MLAITMRALGTGEIGCWATKEHRRHGYIPEATRAAAHRSYTGLAHDRLDWRAELGNTASRADAQRLAAVPGPQGAAGGGPGLSLVPLGGGGPRHHPRRPPVVLVAVTARPPGTAGSSLTRAVAQAVIENCQL
ncbi:GNAT family N-acetyltransferase, partial [Streptomyces sp. SP17KL33]|uniref:GNAT family N-acetyltransferase n=1 Tax=Streptomyces sp. SP17KL33 TaxID=3002534 RepID=UPI003FCE4D90